MKSAAKITFAESKHFSPEHNLTVREKNSLEQVAFWHEVKVVCCLPIPPFTLSSSSREAAAKKISIWVFFHLQ